MKLSQTAAYAISALVQLAAEGSSTPVPCSVMAQRAALPEGYLLQILRQLGLAEVLKSTRGVHGGYRLTRPAEEITLLEIVAAIDSAAVDSAVVDDNEVYLSSLAPSSQKLIDAALRGIADDARQRLSAIALADLKSAGKTAAMSA